MFDESIGNPAIQAAASRGNSLIPQQLNNEPRVSIRHKNAAESIEKVTEFDSLRTLPAWLTAYCEKLIGRVDCVMSPFVDELRGTEIGKRVTWKDLRSHEYGKLLTEQALLQEIEMNWEHITGWVALIVTCGYVSISYPREIIQAWKGNSSMTPAFQAAASLTFASWVWHSLAHDQGTNYIILVPNLVGMLSAITLTGVLLRNARQKKSLERDINE